MKIPVIAAVSLIAYALTSCATITRGTNSNLNVASIPEKALVTSDKPIISERIKRRQKKEFLNSGLYMEADLTTEMTDFYACPATPCKIKLSRRSDFTLYLDHEGHHRAVIPITNGFGRGGVTTGSTSAIMGATGGYLVSYSIYTALAGFVTAFGAAGASIASFGLVSSTAAVGANAGAASAATALAGVVGVGMLGVDLASGAMLNLQPNPVSVVLVPDFEPLPDVNTLAESEEAAKRLINKIYGQGGGKDG